MSLQVRTMADMMATGETPEILFWVGCAGSFDDRAKKITKALVKILNHCNVNFAVLGSEESCTGDPAKRAGNEFTTLSKIAEVIKKSGVKNIVLDGEVCILDKKGDEDFQGIIKEIKRKNHTIKRPKFLVFDALTHTEFIEKMSGRKFSARQEYLQGWLKRYKSGMG